MSSERFHTAMLVAWICLGAAASLATTVPPSRRTFSKPSASTVVWREKDGKHEAIRMGNDESSIPIGVNIRLPPSPANLLKPDGFQFYAYNERGDMITKQMSMQDIQALIASGGPIHSHVQFQQPQKADDILTGGKKVMDVVEKVQNVLKSAMGKPFYALTDSIPTVPEKESAEWSNILPGILAGDKFEETDYGPTLESTYSSDDSLVKVDTPETSTAKHQQPLQQQLNMGGDSLKRTTQTINSFAVTREPTITLQTTTRSYTEKLMIPVSVITAKDKPQTTPPKATETESSTSSFDTSSSTSKPSLTHSSTVEAEATRYTAAMEANPPPPPPTISSIPTETSTRPTSDEIQSHVKSKPTTLHDNETLSASTESATLLNSTQAIAVDNPSTEPLAVSPSAVTDPVTKPSDLSTTPHVKPLSEELADSLSSVINQVSENVSSVLSVSSDMAQAEHAVEEKEKEDSATTSITESHEATNVTTLDNESTTNHEDISTLTIGEFEQAANVTSDGTVELSTPLIANESLTNSTNLSASNDGKNPWNVAQWVLAAVDEISEQQMALLSPERRNSTSNGVVTLVLPDISQNVPTKTLASSLIAGFGPITSVDSNATLNESSFEADATQPTVSPITTQLLNKHAPVENVTNENDSSSLPTTERQTVPLEITTNSDLKYFETEAESPTDSTTFASATTDFLHSDVTDETLPTRTPLETTMPTTLNEENSTPAANVEDFPSTLLDSREESSERNATRGGEAATLPLRVENGTTATPSPPIIFESSTKKDDGDSTRTNETSTKAWPTKEMEETTVVYETVSKNRNESLVSTTNSGATSPMESYTTESANVSVEGETRQEQKQEKREEEVWLKSETGNSFATVLTENVTSNPLLKSETAPASNSVGWKEVSATSGTSSPGDATKGNGSESVASTEAIGSASDRSNVTLENSGSVKEKNASSTEVELEQKWQRISLHQTVPLTSTVTKKAAVSTTEAAPAPATAPAPAPAPEEDAETRDQLTPGTKTESTLALDSSKSVGGLDSSTKNTSIDIVNFSRLCNELAFKFWIAANKGLSSGRSLALSPFGMLTLLSMIFLGARGSTSDQMNEILGLDNVATFNPHLIFQNVTDAVSLARQHQGIANAAFVRELFADKAKIRKLMPFYKEQAQQFYEGLVAEVNFATISDLARRRTNLLIRKQTGGRIKDFVRSNAVPLRSPLAAISANVFQTDCNTSLASTRGRDGELYFAVSSAQRLRKLVPVPATVWRSNVLAGYEPSLDATAVALGGLDKLVSTIFLLPGQGQGHAAPGDTLDRLEQRLVKGASFRDGSWNKLLKVLVPRNGLELQIPKFSHRSVVNATSALKRMGLDQLFSSDADFRGINGIGNRLFLSDVLQMNLFSTCGDESIVNGRHHVETYPASPTWRNSRRDQLSNAARSTLDSVSDHRAASVAGTRSSPGKTEDRPRLKLDQPFLYFVRHNPTGLLLHMGRFNPRLL